MLEGATLSVLSRPALLPHGVAAHWWFGCDPTPGIVAVHATNAGRASVWRRDAAGQLERTEHRFLNWFLTNTREMLAHLPVQDLDVALLREGNGALSPNLGGSLGLITLEGITGRDATRAFRFLVLAENLAEVEPALLETYDKRTSSSPRTLADLSGQVLAWPPDDQFLLLTGRTYYKGLRYVDLHRLQFDLETTGLDERRDRIIMISMRDSTGWETCLDTSRMNEAALLERFVEQVRLRDPDVLENHNIFAFDLSFLMRRASSLGVRLALGRDGSEPAPVRDVVRIGARREPFVRWTIAGRQVIDTLHAVKRYGATAPDMRRLGLKEVARYFGFARPDREYIPGPEVSRTFQRDPERVRRYALDDVREVDELSRRLLPSTVALAQVVPRSLEQLAVDSGPRGLLDPLLVRGYLREGAALPRPAPRSGKPGDARAKPEVFARGVVPHVVDVALVPLALSTLVEARHPSGYDPLNAVTRLAEDLLRQIQDPGDAHLAAYHELAEALPRYLESSAAIFSNPLVAAEVRTLVRQHVERVLNFAAGQGVRPVWADGDRLLLGLPGSWDEQHLHAFASQAEQVLPSGVRVEVRGRYRASYVAEDGSYVLLGENGTLATAGTPLLNGRLERFGETFLLAAAQRVLEGDVVGLRRLFLEAVAQLRAHAVPLDQLCVRATLHKTPADYQRGSQGEEPYEVLLASGARSWRSGQRIRYFRDRTGSWRLLEESGAARPADADPEHYVQRLLFPFCRYFTAAFEPRDYARLFQVPVPTAAERPEQVADIRLAPAERT